MMGHVSHHAIIVTGCIDGLVGQAHRSAYLSGLTPTPVATGRTNGYESFMVPPDGGKEGMATALETSDRRDHFKDALRRPPFVSGCGNLLISWVEVHFDRRLPGADIVDGDAINRNESE